MTLSITVLSAILLSIVLLIVAIFDFYAECRYAECRYAECRCAKKHIQHNLHHYQCVALSFDSGYAARGVNYAEKSL
jgi:hypothetical protein